MINRLGEIIGHTRAVAELKGAIVSRRVAHAYLLAGPPGVGKETLALAFGRALLCQESQGGDSCGTCFSCRRASDGTHPDLAVVRPDGASIKIGQIRLLQRETRFGPRTGSWFVIVVEGAETMTPDAANSLLKTLEEPPRGMVFVLLTTAPQKILPTVLSRCQQIFLQPLMEPELAQGLARHGMDWAEELPLALAGGSLGRALAMALGEGLAERDRIIDLAIKLTGAGSYAALELAGLLAGAAPRGKSGPAAGRKQVGALLDLLMLWYRDIMLVRECAGGKHIVNRDRAEDIEKMAGIYTTGRILAMITHIEQAKGALAAGANVRLTIESLFLRLGKRAGGDRAEGGV
jgi:DNA polymerase-3 subunit delta'